MTTDVRGRGGDPTRGQCGARHTLLASGSLLIENSVLPADRPLGRGYSAETQIVLPYHGAFSWSVGREHRLVDPNAVLFVTGGEEFLETHPVAGVGHGSAILTPSPELLDEVPPDPDGMRSVTSPMSDGARLTLHALLFDPVIEPLAREELAVELLCDLFAGRRQRGGMSRPVVDRAKEVLHAHSHEVLSLEFVSRAVGVTPIYLTQTFSRSEGMPLYRYQMRLRLARALLELRSCESLTELALDLGFSSHSHFTTVFRGAFGLTPSAFRALHRPRN